tara:strand:+ start:925 stop:1077 length:153 start_codon:yes stop_codon:yes gene_type:complete
MNIDDLKMGFINFSAFTMSFTNIEIGLKLTLLTVTIIYTVIKIIKISKEE